MAQGAKRTLVKVTFLGLYVLLVGCGATAYGIVMGRVWRSTTAGWITAGALAAAMGVASAIVPGQLRRLRAWAEGYGGSDMRK